MRAPLRQSLCRGPKARAACIGAASGGPTALFHSHSAPTTTAEPQFTGVELQIALEIAHALLDHASIAFNPETMQRLHRKARRTYHAVMKLIGTLPPADSRRVHIGKLLATLKERLGAAPHHSARLEG